MRTIVLGAAGQLGRDLVPRLAGEILPWTRADVDLTNGPALHEKLSAARPDVVVNCAAYNLVDQAERDPQAAFAVNTWGVQHLADACHAIGARLVHVSTDYVFGLDEGQNTPWREDDTPGPVSQYGLSKLTGEYLVRARCANHLIVRTCGLYGLWGVGGKGGNFVETMLRVAQAGKPLRVVNDQRCTPSYCVDVAEGIVSLLATNSVGVFHVTNAGSCTWYEFAYEIFRLCDRRADLSPITSDEYGAAARRPAYSVLANSRMATLGLPPLRPWQQALQAYFEQREQPR